MAHLRLLAVAIALVSAASTLSCSRCSGSRSVEVPRLAGQILDERTGKPIEGMTVYQVYSTFNKMMVGAAHEGGGERDERWTTTDAEGRFEFAAHVVAEDLKICRVARTSIATSWHVSAPFPKAERLGETDLARSSRSTRRMIGSGPGRRVTSNEGNMTSI